MEDRLTKAENQRMLMRVIPVGLLQWTIKLVLVILLSGMIILPRMGFRHNQNKMEIGGIHDYDSLHRDSSKYKLTYRKLK